MNSHEAKCPYCLKQVSLSTDITDDLMESDESYGECEDCNKYFVIEMRVYVHFESRELESLGWCPNCYNRDFSEDLICSKCKYRFNKGT